MVKRKNAEPKSEGIVIEKMQVGNMAVTIVGDTPLIMHAMSAKARGTLLFPAGRKTTAEKAQTMKHEPMQEFVASCYRSRNGNAATRLMMPTMAFKSALCNAALEVPGTKKTQIGRLAWFMGNETEVYGVPELLMSVVRSADINKTPDIRTRAILPQWACKLNVRFVMPTLNATSIARLLETAGLVIGVGDFRQEKGKGNYGQFHIADDGEADEIIAKGGRKQQDAALAKPRCYDEETETLLAWFEAERIRRGKTK